MRQYIGIIYWADGSGVLDNTTTGGMHSVWKQCCKAHRLHSGRITIHKATSSDTVGTPIKEFISVDDCIAQYNMEYKHANS